MSDSIFNATVAKPGELGRLKSRLQARSET
jgi:hypothetical protein